MITFQDLGLIDEILTTVTELGYEVPMPIQEQVIPFIINNDSDVVALAQTGTGKTAAFGLPVLQNMDGNLAQTQALILSPTRELCMQIANDLTAYAKRLPDVHIVALYGGESIVNQFKRLDVKPQVIVATPGRLIDLIKREKVSLDKVRFLILDEADEMLNMGFLEDLETILKSVPSTRRTMLFSATMPLPIAAIAKNYMTNAKEISVGVRNAGAANVEHIYYLVQSSLRYQALKRVVDINPDIYGIVFCRTRQETKDVAEKLMRDGYNADALHGDLSQAQRDMVMNKFRIRNLQLLVATDVAARGLDVSDLTHIINYNIPTDVEIYTHRSGRTGRANKTGISVALVTQKEQPRIREIERVIGKSFTKLAIPNGIEVCRAQLLRKIDKLQELQISDEQINVFMPQILEKLEDMNKEEVIRRFVTLEFQNFLTYYQDAQDINCPAEGKKRTSDRERTRNNGNQDGKKGKKLRFKLDVGRNDNASPRVILAMINEVTHDNSIHIGDIEITKKYTFFDVYADQADQLQTAFQKNSFEGISLSKVTPRKDESEEENVYRQNSRRGREENVWGNKSNRKFKKRSRY